MRKLLPLLGLLLLCCASCFVPFDLSMSQAAATVGKLNYQSTIGPVTNLDGDIEAENVMFLPNKTDAAPWISYTDGFLVARRPGHVQLTYARFEVGTGEYHIYGSWGEGTSGSSSRYESFVFEALKLDMPLEKSLGILSDRDPWNPVNRSAEIRKALTPPPAPPAPPIVMGPSGTMSMISTFPYVMGYSVRPTTGMLADRAYWLARVGLATDADFQEKEFDLSAAGLMLPTDLRPFQVDLPQLDGVTRCQYFYDFYPPLPEDRRSYANWYDTSRERWRCISWKGIVDPPEVVELDGVRHRIDALLSNGLLFSTQDGTGRLYESNGNEVASFPLGSLRFVGERFLGATDIPTVIFTLGRVVSGTGSRSLSVDLYTLPTVDLSEL